MFYTSTCIYPLVLQLAPGWSYVFLLCWQFRASSLWNNPGAYASILWFFLKHICSCQAIDIVRVLQVEMVRGAGMLCACANNISMMFVDSSVMFFQNDYVSGWMSKVHLQSFWMMAYGAPTPKRLMVRSNWLRISELDCGRLARRYMQEKTEFQTASILMTVLPEAC